MINETLYERYPNLTVCREDIASAYQMLVDCFSNGGKLLLCGNGGSCADCDHIVGELMKGFLNLRPLTEEKKEQMKAGCPLLSEESLNCLQQALPAISLPSLTALTTAFCNDVAPELVFAQCVMGLGQEKDVLIAISTSGNSKNILRAAEVARSLGLRVIALTGGNGGALRSLADVCICVPESETFKVQELHLPVYHELCAAVEAHFFG